MYKTERICRLCLKTSEHGFIIIDETAKAILDTLSLKIDLSITKEPVICRNCMTTLQKSSHLMSTCQNTRDSIFPFAINKTFSIKGNKEIKITDSTNYNYKICLFCMQIVQKDSYSLLNQLEEDLVAVKQFLPKCIFDLYITVAEEPILCKLCHDSIQNHISYLKSFVEVERKVKNYYKVEEIDSKIQIDQDCILRFALTRNDVDNGELNLTKQETNTRWSEQATEAEVQIKNEDKETIDVDVNKEPEVTNVIASVINTENNQNDNHTVESHEAHVRNPSQAIYKCNTCSYQTISKAVDAEIYKCNACPYETNNKVYFRKHSVIHKDVSETRTFKCDICSFRTKYNWYLKIHTLLHKDASHATMYSCEVCPYNTKIPGNFKRHLLNHYDAPEYKCDKCSYVTKHKQSFNRHAITHKSPSEVTMYNCETCSYTTRYKKNITLHVVLHKDPSEVTMYQCDSCPYKTRTKQNLKLHSLIHKSNSEVKMYKCQFCRYKTKRITNLSQHMLVHKKPSEVNMFRCDLCSYATKRKSSLKEHMIVHRKPSKLTMYKCESCSYESKRKGMLKQHMLTHKNVLDNSVVSENQNMEVSMERV